MSKIDEFLKTLSESHSKQIAERTEQYRWKAENIVRFFDHLGMTTEQKVDFLAQELGTVHWLAALKG